MGSVNPPKKRDYSHKTRIDLKQSYQVAYWKERFGVSEQELSEAVLAAGALARKVEEYLGPRKRVKPARQDNENDEEFA